MLITLLLRSDNDLFEQQLDRFHTLQERNTLFYTFSCHLHRPSPQRIRVAANECLLQFFSHKKANISDLICWNLGSDCESFMEQKIKIYFHEQLVSSVFVSIQKKKLARAVYFCMNPVYLPLYPRKCFIACFSCHTINNCNQST